MSAALCEELSRRMNQAGFLFTTCLNVCMCWATCNSVNRIDSYVKSLPIPLEQSDKDGCSFIYKLCHISPFTKGGQKRSPSSKLLLWSLPSVLPSQSYFLPLPNIQHGLPERRNIPSNRKVRLVLAWEDANENSLESAVFGHLSGKEAESEQQVNRLPVLKGEWEVISLGLLPSISLHLTRGTSERKNPRVLCPGFKVENMTFGNSIIRRPPFHVKRLTTKCGECQSTVKCELLYFKLLW